jgi:nucleoid-associated protein YgaU
LISKEYYKTPDFAAALEAYNKDRRKPGEQFIRVPPTWVLEEQFPNLVGPKGDKPTAPEPNAAGNVKFEPADPTTPARRPTPPLISGTNDEYRVKAEAGETIREIARKVYGNPDSWKKLWDLNPSLDPTQPIPSGTTLRVGR